MGKQTNKQFHLKSVDTNSNKFKINDVDVSLLRDGIKIKGEVYFFLKIFLYLLLIKM